MIAIPTKAKIDFFLDNLMSDFTKKEASKPWG
jgi:hypothetical protein